MLVLGRQELLDVFVKLEEAGLIQSVILGSESPEFGLYAGTLGQKEEHG